MKFLRRDTEIIYVNQTGFHSMFNYVNNSGDRRRISVDLRV